VDHMAGRSFLSSASWMGGRHGRGLGSARCWLRAAALLQQTGDTPKSGQDPGRVHSIGGRISASSAALLFPRTI
jgi:hypothetical protein